MSSQSELEIAERRATTSAMILAGYTYREIAKYVNCSLGTVAADRAAIMLEWRQTYLENVGEAAVIDLARLDRVIQRLTARIDTDDDPRHVMALLATLKRRADILGYDAADRAKTGLQIAPLEDAIDVHSEGPLLTPDGRPVANRAAARIYAAFACPVPDDNDASGGCAAP